MMQYTEKYKVASEDVVAIQPAQDVLYQECCDCGLQHRIEIIERGPTLRLRFVRLGYDGAAEADSKTRGYNGFETHIEEAPNAEFTGGPLGPSGGICGSTPTED